MPMRSTQPSATAYRAVGMSAMRVACRTGMSTAARTVRHSSRNGADGVPMPGMDSASARSDSMRPPVMETNWIPWSAYCRRIAIASSLVSPSSRSWSMLMRMPTTKSSGTAARTASMRRRGTRRRFSSEPPYSSSRWLSHGETKESMK